MQWLDIIGIGEDGYEALSVNAKEALINAEVIIGGSRHHALVPEMQATRIHWPKPFSKMISTVKSHYPKRTALLVTGDPLWYSAGNIILKSFPLNEINFHPQISAFQLACAKMGWSLTEIETLTAHGRPIEQILPFVRPRAQLVVLTGGSETTYAAAQLLSLQQYGNSRFTVLSDLGGASESRLDGIAGLWAKADPTKLIASFNTLCIECVADQDAQVLHNSPGLPDEKYETDGNFTKQHVRAITVCMLAPHKGGLLWDIGAGCGTVAIEWMRAARDSKAIAIDHNRARLQLATRNSIQFGTPSLQVVEGHAPEILENLPQPNAIFIGGGLSRNLAELAIKRLPSKGRLVVNAVTLESEAILNQLYSSIGGDLTRIGISRADSLGSVSGWRNQMTVTQWRFVK